MKNFKGLGKAALIMIAAALLATGCSKGKDTETQPQQTQAETQKTTIAIETQPETVEETQAPEDEIQLKEGQMYSFLTGEPIEISIGQQRPVAVMINNIDEAVPQQAGTSAADILYEAVVEGNITRLMAIFQDTSKIERVGSVRSSRHYYLDFANNFDAIYCHYGWSAYAQERITSNGIKTVGQFLNNAYYPDNNFPAPHHIFATGDTLEAGISSIDVDRNHPDGYTGCFEFNTKDVDPEYGTIANTVKIPFVFSKSELQYDSTTKLYDKYQYNAPHLDSNNAEQLKFKNIIIQYAKYSDMGDSSGCQDIALDGSGKAIYITDGKAINVTWKRANANEQTKYYYEDGSQVKMNPGKTYIAVVPESFDITLSE